MWHVKKLITILLNLQHNFEFFREDLSTRRNHGSWVAWWNKLQCLKAVPGPVVEFEYNKWIFLPILQVPIVELCLLWIGIEAFTLCSGLFMSVCNTIPSVHTAMH
jgi:hypothetical protein